MSQDLIVVDSKQKFHLDKDVLLQRFEDKALLLDLERERVYQLSDTGTRITELLSAGHPYGTIIAMLEETYAVETDELEAQVRDLIGELVAQGLIVRE